MDAELFESVPNFSEGRDLHVIDAITQSATAAHVLDVDANPDHNRFVLSVAATRGPLLDALVGAASAAAEGIDLRAHRGLHPRVGSADVMPIVPLGGTSIEACRELAQALGQRIWDELHLPVFFYGHGQARALADIRAGRALPDLGGPLLHPTAGAVCVGARKPLVAFNVLLPGMSVSAARALARSLRESGGGLRGVQALVFELPGADVQLSMNLFRLDETTPAGVVAELERRGVALGPQEVVGLCPAAAANTAAAGRLLEARLGAAAAREGARRCRAIGDGERNALAAKLEAEAEGLAAIGAGQDELLAGAERCFALPRVLRAAGTVNPELSAMSLIASRGLRAAVDAETTAAFAARVDALDRGLAASD